MFHCFLFNIFLNGSALKLQAHKIPHLLKLNERHVDLLWACFPLHKIRL